MTLFVNWLVKPFSMAFLGWLFFKHLFLPWIGPELADQYVGGRDHSRGCAVYRDGLRLVVPDER